MLFKKISNLSENLIYILVTNTFTALLVFTITFKAFTGGFGMFIPAAEEAFRKPTNNISNEYETNIKKQKVKKGAATIDYTPQVENVIVQPLDTTLIETKKPTEKKKGFFKRLFNK